MPPGSPRARTDPAGGGHQKHLRPAPEAEAQAEAGRCGAEGAGRRGGRGLTGLHQHLLGHHGAVEEERGGALLVAGLVEEVQDEFLDLAVVAVQQLLEELGVCEAQGLVHAVAYPQHPQVVHGAAQGRVAPREPSACGRESVATAPLATAARATAATDARPAVPGSAGTCPRTRRGSNGNPGGRVASSPGRRAGEPPPSRRGGGGSFPGRGPTFPCSPNGWGAARTPRGCIERCVWPGVVTDWGPRGAPGVVSCDSHRCPDQFPV